jgi:8-oxo-dGTP diphosphatase
MNVVNVVCGIIFKDDLILVTQRSQLMNLPLKWEFPGGKQQNNETEQACLHREISEELGIKIKIISRFCEKPHAYETLKINLIAYTAKYLEGEVTLFEHKKYLWIKKVDLPSLEWAAADLTIMKKLLGR